MTDAFLNGNCRKSREQQAHHFIHYTSYSELFLVGRLFITAGCMCFGMCRRKHLID